MNYKAIIFYLGLFIFPLSGGVIARSKTINLPTLILSIIDFIDNLLISISSKLFPLGMEVVIEKK